jgi:hypothetical protein
MSSRPTKAQLQQRVGEVLQIRLAGAEMPGVREYVREKEAEDGSPWQLADGQKPLSDSQIWRYISKADKQLEASTRASRKKHLRRHLARRNELYARAFNAGDYRTALAVLDSQAKLMGLDDTEQAAEIARLKERLHALESGAAGAGGDRDAAGGAGAPPAGGGAGPGAG